MKTVAKPVEPAERQARFDHVQPHYLEALTLIERLHRRLLDVIKDEFDRRGRADINAVQALLLFNILVPQVLWFRAIRTNVVVLFVVAICVNIGMWLERYVIVVVSLARDFMPSAWGRYSATFWDYGVFIGSIGLFFAALFLFVRFLPMISIFEMRELVHDTETEESR